MNALTQIKDPRVTYKRLSLRPRSTVARMRWLKSIRPVTRGDCVDGIRPCPFASCKHHMVHAFKWWQHGELPDLDALPDTCVLDIVDRPPTPDDAASRREGLSLTAVARAMGLTRERARQIEHNGIEGLRDLQLAPDDYIDAPPSPASVTPPLMSRAAREAAMRERRAVVITEGLAAGDMWSIIAARLTERGVETRRGSIEWTGQLARREANQLGLDTRRHTMADDAVSYGEAAGVLSGALLMPVFRAAGAVDSTAYRVAPRAAERLGWVKYEVRGLRTRKAYAPPGLAAAEVRRRIIAAESEDDQ